MVRFSDIGLGAIFELIDVCEALECPVEVDVQVRGARRHYIADGLRPACSRSYIDPTMSPRTSWGRAHLYPDAICLPFSYAASFRHAL